MIAEGMILLRIKHLQQGRSGIATEIKSHLVDFVEHEHGVANAHIAHGLNDATGHGADVGAAMPSYFRFVSYAAE